MVRDSGNVSDFVCRNIPKIAQVKIVVFSAFESGSIAALLLCTYAAVDSQIAEVVM